MLALPQGVFNTGHKGLPHSLPMALGQAGVCGVHSPSLELILSWAVPRSPECAGIHREHCGVMEHATQWDRYLSWHAPAPAARRLVTVAVPSSSVAPGGLGAASTAPRAETLLTARPSCFQQVVERSDEMR